MGELNSKKLEAARSEALWPAELAVVAHKLAALIRHESLILVGLELHLLAVMMVAQCGCLLLLLAHGVLVGAHGARRGKQVVARRRVLRAAASGRLVLLLLQLVEIIVLDLLASLESAHGKHRDRLGATVAGLVKRIAGTIGIWLLLNP